MAGVHVSSSYEHRAAPRTIVDIDAELVVPIGVITGTIHDLSFLGSLFMTEELSPVEAGTSGSLNFVLPTSAERFSPRIDVRRTTTFPRPGGKSAQAIGFAFSGLQPNEERAIALACMEWNSVSLREFPLAVQCFVQGQYEVQNFSRFGRLSRGSREQVCIHFDKDTPLQRRHLVRLKVGQVAVMARVTSTTETRIGWDVTAQIDGWGRDFFLHEARRGAVSDVRSRRDP